MRKFVLHPATFKLDGGAMFGIIPKPLWEKKIIPDEKNRILMSLRVVYIELGEKKILIDTGIGDYHSEKFSEQFAINSDKKPLQGLLKKHFKISADQVTDIILTHLHFDHVGGLGIGENGSELQFPNARIHLHKKHYDYALNATARDSGSFQKHFFEPLLDTYIQKKQLTFLTEDSGTILEFAGEKIEYIISKGHTPYMIHPIFDNYIYMADLVPMEHHINIPWVMGYDIEPGVTTEYKEKIYQLILDRKLNMIFEHDNDIAFAKLKKNEKGVYISDASVKNESIVQELN